MKKISIVTINLNNADGLHQTIKSIINQNFKDYELIIVDGGSTDGSNSIIEKYDNSIDYIISEVDNGIYNAMNKGIIKSNGEYLIFMNSGDCFINNSVLQKAIDTGLDAVIVCCSVKCFKNPVKSFYYFYNDSLPHQSLIIKRSLFDEIGLYDETFKIISDWCFYVIALIKYNKKIKFLNFDLHIGQPGGISWTNDHLIQKEKSEFISSNFSYIADDYRDLSQYRRSRIIRMYDKLVKVKFLLWIFKKFRF